MHRAFERSRGRRRTYLDGRWEFATGDPDGSPVDDSDVADPSDLDPTIPFAGETDEMTVPGCWQTRPAYHDHHGVAWYRREFHWPAESNVRLRFEAVAREATVFLDGETVLSHVGGYTPFETVLRDLGPGEHELVVRVDSALDEESIPRPGSDWFPYGGITREVFVEAVPDVFVDDLRVEYALDNGEETGETLPETDGVRATVEATVAVRNLGDEPAEREVGFRIGDRRKGGTVEVTPGTTPVERTIELDDVTLWSPADPHLYEAVATVGRDGSGNDRPELEDRRERDDRRQRDDRRERVGFREVRVEGTDVLLNGEPVEFRGVNRHEDHPEWGHTQPARLMELDLDLLDRAGFDTVRTSHYPNHPRFLDYCDEEGVLVIEEIPYWQFGPERFARGDVLERGERTLGAMIERDYHHPSVVAWSLHNECATGTDGVYEATERLAATARDHDDTRPLTYATNTDFEGGEERCHDLVDFLCCNAYWGWYDDSRSWPEFLDAMTDRYAGTPVVLSEFGAGAVADERTFEGQKWSESYQADLLAETIETVRETDGVVGFTVWQYCDTRTHPDNFAGRPKTKNNKGILTEYRRPKEAYGRLRRILRDE